MEQSDHGHHPHRNLTHLEVLDLGGNQINNITAVRNLTDLTSLSMWNNQITDITPIGNLTHLEVLDLGGNQINNITAVRNLTHLIELFVNDNQITDITALKDLTNLKVLVLKHNQITDVNPLVGLVNLEKLYLAGNPIEDFSPLRILLANNPNLKIDIDIPDAPPLAFSPGTIADQTFTVGEAVNLTLPIAAGGTPPYTYTLTPLPGGLSFDATERELSGTPTTAGTTTTTYTATDAASGSVSLTFTIEVTAGVILDVNGDGQVTVIDLAIIALFYGTKVPAGSSHRADVNSDRTVDLDDLVAVAQGIDTDGSDALTLDALEAALAEAVEIETIAEAPMLGGTRPDNFRAILSNRNLAYRNVADALADAGHLGHSVSAVLTRLLQLLKEMTETPPETALLPNYPNPFNPETWIPYHLAQDAAVVLTIYDVRGSVVRELVLGHQPAGVYQSKHRAAYWDGRNESGESVASGVYFYTLTAGDFTATRRLLVIK